MFHRSSQQIQSLFPFNKKVFKKNPNIKNNADSEWKKKNKQILLGRTIFCTNREVYVNEYIIKLIHQILGYNIW